MSFFARKLWWIGLLCANAENPFISCRYYLVQFISVNISQSHFSWMWKTWRKFQKHVEKKSNQREMEVRYLFMHASNQIRSKKGVPAKNAIKRFWNANLWGRWTTNCKLIITATKPKLKAKGHSLVEEHEHHTARNRWENFSQTRKTRKINWINALCLYPEQTHLILLKRNEERKSGSEDNV